MNLTGCRVLHVPRKLVRVRKKNLSLFLTTIQQLKWKSIPMSLILSLAKRLAAKNLKNLSAEKDLKELATRRNLPKKSSVKQKEKLPSGHQIVQVQAIQTVRAVQAAQAVQTV